MLWPFLIVFGLAVFGACRQAGERTGEWAAFWWVTGVVLMQAPVPEPWRWMYAAALWTIIPLFVGMRIGAARAALVMAAIPLGYWAIAANGFGIVALGTGGLNLAFAVTELAGVAAVLTAGWGGLRHVRDRLAAGRGGRRVRILDPRPSVVVPPHRGKARDQP